MQSGRGNAGRWILEFDQASARRIDALMGWTSSSDTNTQVRMQFDTSEAAQAYATKQGWSFQVLQPKERTVRYKAYADNFRYDRIR
mgnify:CR=1 FL=1